MSLSLEICTGTICINSNQFTIHENSVADSDITILKKIEHIIRESLIYEVNSPQDKYATFAKEEMWEKLKKDAKVIYNKYETDLLCAEIKSEVLNIFSQIENHFKRSFFILPQDMLQFILSFLKIKDLLQVAKVNKIGQASAKQAIEQRMQLFGFKESDFFFQKKNFLNLFKIVPYMLTKDDFKNFATSNLDSTLDTEETFKRIKNADVYKLFLANQLLAFIRHKKEMGVLEWISNMGVDPNNLIEITDLLCNAGAHVNHKIQIIKYQIIMDGYTALHCAAEIGDLELVNALLNHGADVNIQTAHGYTALHFAVEGKNLELVNTLLNHGADVNIQTINDCTVLHFAVEKGDLELVKIFLNHGADVNIQEVDGSGALHFASEKEDLEFVNALLNHDADVNLQTVEGYTVLQSAAEEGKLELVKILLNHGADVNLQAAIDGSSPLHLAAENNHLDIVEFLIKNGADRSLKDKKGNTPSQLAEAMGAAQELIDLLKLTS